MQSYSNNPPPHDHSLCFDNIKMLGGGRRSSPLKIAERCCAASSRRYSKLTLKGEEGQQLCPWMIFHGEFSGQQMITLIRG